MHHKCTNRTVQCTEDSTNNTGQVVLLMELINLAMKGS